MELVWLDTDIGSDIDDSLCLNYLLNKHDCEVIGITTVGGNGKQRAMVSDCMCKLENKDIPIFIGSEEPFIGEQLQVICQQAEFLKKYPHKNDYQELGAGLKLLRDLIMKNPNEVTLLGIGAMTNIAILFSLYPEVKMNLKSLVLMIGRFQHSDSPASHTPICEWNSLCDPVASKIVFNSLVKEIKCVSLDVTQNLLKPSTWVKEVFHTKGMQPVFDYFKKWTNDRGEIIFHDPVAAIAIFEPELIEWEPYQIDVLTENTPMIGMTYAVHSDHHPMVLVSKKINEHSTFNHFIKCFTNNK